MSYRSTILLICGLALIPAGGRAATGETGWQGTSWGETSSALAARFRKQETSLDRPLDFGDAHVDVVLKNYPIGGYPFIVYFQMGNDGTGLKRIQIERARHGAVPQVSAAAFKELATLYGPPTESCAAPARTVTRHAHTTATTSSPRPIITS